MSNFFKGIIKNILPTIQHLTKFHMELIFKCFVNFILSFLLKNSLKPYWPHKKYKKYFFLI